jgi:hypothetical protein
MGLLRTPMVELPQSRASLIGRAAVLAARSRDERADREHGRATRAHATPF